MKVTETTTTNCLVLYNSNMCDVLTHKKNLLFPFNTSLFLHFITLLNKGLHDLRLKYRNKLKFLLSGQRVRSSSTLKLKKMSIKQLPNVLSLNHHIQHLILDDFFFIKNNFFCRKSCKALNQSDIVCMPTANLVLQSETASECEFFIT